jgi:hypothetical protein
MKNSAYVKTMVQLATSGFGLVAALAWNSAIQALFKKLFGETNGNILSLFGYAVFITLIIVFITTRLAKLAERVEKSDEKKGKG